MQIFVTRTHPEAALSIKRLHNMGFAAHATPLMEIVFKPPRPDEMIDLRPDDALAFTSANGVRAAIHTGIPAHHRLCFCVGQATARAAHLAGFAPIYEAGGDVHDLADLILEHAAQPENRPGFTRIIHPAAHRLAGDLGAFLRPGRIAYRKHVCYEAQACAQLPEQLAFALQPDQPPVIVMLYSPRTAVILQQLCQKAGLDNPNHHQLYALSRNVAEKLNPHWWHKIKIAAQPNEDALFSMLQHKIPKEDAKTLRP
ncbi:MAG: uroporphyrinogen-III synthase [Pseudomonadota bacterium]